ncbi:TlpA family protein disulfide reductase [Pedobacter sp. AW1-32]|uniref:TlpA family protein disulfide reductase n=1 Tax=Pedobacter sp. AW1-32 TaxID=3383026 RepID=UPI003FEF06BC
MTTFFVHAQETPVKWATRESYFEDLAGTDVKAFKGKTVQGKIFDSKSLKNKIVLINFWFEKCPPCVAEMPELNRLVETYQSKDIRFIAITTDPVAKARIFQKKMSYQYEVVCMSLTQIQQLNINNGFPTNVLVGANGKIIKAMANLSFSNDLPELKLQSEDFEKKLKHELSANN